MRARLLFAVPIVLAARIAAADEPPADAPELSEARREFTAGAALVREERWGEALAAFERAARLKSHPVTTYNIAQCERAMGQYTRARRALRVALAENEASPALPESVVAEARTILAEVERILPRVEVSLRPADAAITVDGRPLERAGDDTSYVTGTAAPGTSQPLGLSRFIVLTNPGAHVVVVSRQGYQDVVLNRSFAPSSTTSLDLTLDRLPVQIRVTSNLADAIVRVNDTDVGNPPTEVSRAAGRYRVLVSKKGFVPYDTEVTLRAGEKVDLDATLRPEQTALTQRWWFWTAAGVLVVGAAVGTYFLTRSDAEPSRPPTDGGGLGWSLRVP